MNYERFNQYMESDPKFRSRAKHMLSSKTIAEEKLKKAKEAYEKVLNSDIRRKEVKAQIAMNKVIIYEKSLDLINDKLRFMRPQDDRDISYRGRQYDEFPQRIEALIPDDLPLRFHGCPIYAAEKIIKSGEISSSVDRLGVETSYDGAGQISVTTKDSIGITIQGYTDLTYNYDLPCGCVFVVTPEDRADEEHSEHQLMNSVDFKSDPNRFVAVISTPENLSNLKNWLTESGISPAKAFDFDGFANSIKQVIGSVVIPYSKSYSGMNNIAQSTISQQNRGNSLSLLISNAESRADTQISTEPARDKSINTENRKSHISPGDEGR